MISAHASGNPSKSSAGAGTSAWNAVSVIWVTCMWSAQATSSEPGFSVNPVPAAVGSQQTLVLGSQYT